MVAVQKGASKETAFEEGAHRDTSNREREGERAVTPGETTRRPHRRTIPYDAETDHELCIIINVKRTVLEAC